MAALTGMQWRTNWAVLADPFWLRTVKALGLVTAGAGVYGLVLLALGFRPRDLLPPKRA